MVSEKKKNLVQELTKKIKESAIVGIVNMENLPARQLQNMRAMLKDKNVVMQMTRKKLITRALEASGKEKIEELINKMKGLPALLFSDTNPFSLCAIIQKNKSKAPAKAGQVAPSEIMVKAGPTSFAPGPIISEFASVGIKTKVDGGKLTIVSDAIVAKEGDVISAKLAETLKRLDIQPMEIGLDLVAVWENGLIFDAKQLYIDEAEYERDFTQAAQWAFNLAIECAYPTKDTTEFLVQKGFRDAKAVAIETAYLTEETKEELLARSEQQALSLKREAKI